MIGVKRVSIFVVILLSLGAMALPWWLGTRDVDFLTPPSEAQLASLRGEITQALPTQIAVPLPTDIQRVEQGKIQSTIKPPPKIDPGDLLASAPLETYREHTKSNAADFIELAVYLEEQSGNHRALLAWERVLDSCQPDAAQRTAALSGVLRLRPLVPLRLADAQAVSHLILAAKVSTGLPTDGLETALAESAATLTKCSAGILRFKAQVERLTVPKKKGPKMFPPPAVPAAVISLRIAETGEGATATGQIDVPLSADVAQMRRGILAAAYKLVSSQLAATTDLTPPAPLSANANPADALTTCITRLGWAVFDKSLRPENKP
jgi:hypothetical protein